MAARWLQQKLRKLRKQRRGKAPVKHFSTDGFKEEVIEKQLAQEYLSPQKLTHKGKSRTQAQSGERSTVKREFLSSWIAGNATRSILVDEELLQKMADLFPDQRGKFRLFLGTPEGRKIALETAEELKNGRGEIVWHRNVILVRGSKQIIRMFFNEAHSRVHFMRVDLVGVSISKTYGSRALAMSAWDNRIVKWEVEEYFD